MFKPFPGQVNYPELELRILDFWKEQRIFELLQEQLREAPRWSFLDGPITANNPMGVHHAWGRTYKDIFCRYKAMRGFNQRWQNGFDCQGLWVEVEVEKALGLNSKREIEAFGLEKFSQECKKRVETFAERIAQQSIRLGQWMRWYGETPTPSPEAGKGRKIPLSYFTFDDNNIEHIWYFLKKCEELGWLFVGHRSMPWCWRCGTSLSQHELADSYIEKTDPSVYFKCEIVERPGEHFLVWTTTPWTLTSNTALAISPDLNYVKVKVGNDLLWLAEARAETLFKGEVEWLATVKGNALLGLTYRGPMEDLPAQANVNRRTIPWDVIAADEGTGIVHIAPGCGAEDFELGKLHNLDVIVPIDENGYFGAEIGWLAGKHVTESAKLIRENLANARSSILDPPSAVLLRWEDYTHRYPVCWRCKTPLVFRLTDEWFIRCDEIRPRMKRALSQVEFTPDYGQALMQNWLDNMGDWCISRKRFFGLPLPFYVCKCGKRNVIGSRAELRERATQPELADQLPELHRPWIDEIKIQCECGAEVERVTAVGDCWLDAGIVPFSTLNYLPDHLKMEGATRSIRNPQSSILDPQWKDWFPANWISEMREQTRLWFYSMLFMSVTLEDRAPYERVLTYEEMRDEKSEAFSKSAGKMIVFDEAAEKMGADPMRWLFAAAPLSQVFRFGYGPANEVKRKMLTLWNCYGFFAMYANLRDSPQVASVECRVSGNGRGDGDFVTRHTSLAIRSELDRWILARLNTLVRDCNVALESFDAARVTREVEKFIDEYSTWYIRRSRRRVWKSDDLDDKRNCLQTQYEVLVTLSKLIAPIIPFSAEELYQSLVPPVDASAPASVHLCEYPMADEALVDEQLIDDMNNVLRIVNFVHAIRSAHGIKVRQPLSAIYVSPYVFDRLVQYKDVIQSEINVHAVERISPTATLNLSQQYPSVVFINDGDLSVGLEIHVTPELRHEGIARDFVRFVQKSRKEARLNVSDRIETYYWNEGEVVHVAVEEHRDYIMQETLSVKLERAQDHPHDGFKTAFKIAGEAISLTITKVNG